MNHGRRARCAFFFALTVGLAALGGAAARAAGDCLLPLAASPGWSCHAEISNGASVDYCLELREASVGDPASRSFRMTSTGPYFTRCSCEAKGKLPGAAFGESSSFLCLDRDTDTVVNGKVSKTRITGQTFNTSVNLRASYRCEPDPSCEVPRALDAHLPPEGGSLALGPGQQLFQSLSAGGVLDVGYIPGCAGYTGEAPTLVFDVVADVYGGVGFFFDPEPNVGAGILVVSPSGELRCDDRDLYFPVAEDGPYSAWVLTQTPGPQIPGRLFGVYHVED